MSFKVARKPRSQCVECTSEPSLKRLMGPSLKTMKYGGGTTQNISGMETGPSHTKLYYKLLPTTLGEWPKN